MKGLKIIPLFLLLMLLSYLGMLFVEANRQDVTIHFASYESNPTPLGLIVLTSALAGMLACGALCSVELLSLYVTNKKLHRRLRAQTPTPPRTSNFDRAEAEPFDAGS